MKYTLSLLIALGFCVASALSFAQPSALDENSTPSNDLLVIVSQRNAEVVAAAAQQFAQDYPQFRLQARTDAQLSEYDDAGLQSLFGSAGGIFATGLYGPSVSHLRPYFSARDNNQIIINSDHRLVGLSRKGRHTLFNDNSNNNDELLKTLAKARPEGDLKDWLSSMAKAYPEQQSWLKARAYWQAGGTQNATAMMQFLLAALLDESIEVPPPRALASVRWFHQGRYQDAFPKLTDKPVIAVIDHAGGARPADTAVLTELCEQASHDIEHQCVAAVANWGTAALDAIKELKPLGPRLTAIVMLQDFVMGGGEGREQVNDLLKTLNKPVIKAIKLRDRDRETYLLSADGLAQEKVYYQVAMPELQGASQPTVVATAGGVHVEPLTGIRLQPIVAHREGVGSLLERIRRWHQLQIKANAEKRLAIIYYNHPPGRHNIGADNLDVPASLWKILNSLKQAGYNTGELPESQQALLDLMQLRGVNLPRDAGALNDMADRIQTMQPAVYQRWFSELPATVQEEMLRGPFGLLHQQLLIALQANASELAYKMIDHTLEEMHHLLEGLDHPARERADHLIEALEQCYTDALNLRKPNEAACLSKAPAMIDAIRQTGIEGMGGWGEVPGTVMVAKNKILLPGIQLGNIFIGPQPPRGWEINEELLHANLAFPPTHQYLAFYHYLKDHFKADALVHLGRHSTYEFLPRRSVGVAADDYSRIVAGDLPGIYPYIVDGVGEGIQAKRRGLAVMVDHLTPPLKSTPLYDELLQLRQMVESFESHHGSENPVVSDRLVNKIREKIDALNLGEELAEAMSAELAIMGISFEEVDDDLLVHEIGHYLTTLQERFMPLGLHIYGKDWDAQAVAMMLESMAPETKAQSNLWRKLLTVSPRAETEGLLAGLNGQYLVPGQGNDPIRSPDSLPTGRNFYALDSSLIPSPAAWELGKEMAEQARANNSQHKDKREALVLWASDVVRDEGVMIAFGLDMLGLKPKWNSRGLVTGLAHQTLEQTRVRRDTVFTTSGLFRDLYGKQMQLLNQATLMALDASSDRIIQDYPALTIALQNTLQPLQKLARGGKQSLEQNQVAAHWVQQTRELMNQGYAADVAGVTASYRVFGDAPGSYGAGINRMAERSGAWEKRSELAAVYTRRLGHSYGMAQFGAPAQQAFKMQLAAVENTYFGRSSNLYGLIDNNDAFDYLGGLSLAVETLSGTTPNNFVIDHSDPQQFKTQPLKVALRQELRGRFLNPEWLEGLMAHGYAGARTMGSEFLEYLWGWQITNPTLVGDWAWQEVKEVYLDDRYQLQLDEFLQQGHNVHVKTNMLAIMLVAIHKDFWQADQQTREQLAQEFATLVAQHGLPGSGHTDPEHPMLPWLEQYVSAAQWQSLSQTMAKAKPNTQSQLQVHRVREINTLDDEGNKGSVEDKPSQKMGAEAADNNEMSESAASTNPSQSQDSSVTASPWFWWALVAAILVVLLSMVRAIYQANRGLKQ